MKKYLLAFITVLVMGVVIAQPGKKSVAKEKPPTLSEMNKMMEEEMKGMSEEEKAEMRKMMKTVMPELLKKPGPNVISFTDNKKTSICERCKPDQQHPEKKYLPTQM